MNVLSCTCFVALVLFGGFVPATWAAQIHSVTFLINRATGRVLDSNDNGNVYAIQMNGGNFQKWYIHGEGDTFDLTNAHTGRALDSDYTGRVYTIPFNGGNFQKWRIHGEYYQNVQTGRYLDSDHNGRVYTLPINGGPHQQWGSHHEIKF